MSGSGRLYSNVARSADIVSLPGIRSCALATSHPLAHEILVPEIFARIPLVTLVVKVGLCEYHFGLFFFFFVHA